MANYRLEILYQQSQQFYMNVMHYNDVSDSGSPEDLAVAWETICMPYLKLLLVNNCTIVHDRAINLSTLAEYTNPVDQAGSRTGEPMPPTVSAVLALNTAYASRSKKGRIYIPALNEGAQNFGTLDSFYVGEAEDYAGNILNFTGSTGEYQLLIYSRKLNVFTPVENVVVRPYTYTQRRRGFGRGI